jgi:integral membrane protein
MEAAFRRYRFMALVTGTTLILLYTILVIQLTTSQHFQHSPVFSAIARIVGVGHGVVLYPIYLVVATLFAIKARIKLGTLVLMLLAGFVPGLAFYMEHRVAVQYGFLPRERSS